MRKWSVDGLLPLTPGTSYTFRLATVQPWRQWRWGNLVGLPCTTEAQDIVSTLFRWAPVDSYISSPSPPFLPLLLGSSHDKLADSLCHPGPRQIARSWTLCHSRLARRLSPDRRTAFVYGKCADSFCPNGPVADVMQDSCLRDWYRHLCQKIRHSRRQKIYHNICWKILWQQFCRNMSWSGWG